MRTVIVLQHVHVLPDGEEDVKLIGVYRSHETAHAAIERLIVQPGFCEHPRLLDPSVDEEKSGFTMGEYELDKDHWSLGFVSV